LPTTAEVAAFIDQAVTVIIGPITSLRWGFPTRTACIEEAFVSNPITIIINNVTDFFYGARICSADNPTSR
jgi:hypothetical protein